ncbi:hypothetical protein [Desulfofalx alkaliphila]|uniref:hypothetical protein n=1 Tax=Desulfofalx alkaliphila TaxID=105483 RepID=UPI0004E20F26|nr:hypothetical protein [Desulfofalx alkaliphila]
METMAIIFNMLLLYFIFSFAYRYFVKPKQDEHKTQNAGNGQVNIAEKTEEKNLVEDKICGAVVPRSQSYIVVRDDEEHYFCSWDCRQKFLDSQQEDQ